MNNDKLLINPAPEDFHPTGEAESTLDTEHDKSQLGLEIEGNRVAELSSNVKMLVRKRSEILEVSMLWRSPALSFAVISLLGILAILFIGGFLVFNQLGPTIPLFYDAVNKQFSSVDKSFIFIIAILIGIVEFLILRLNTVVFRFDRRLSVSIYWIIFIFNILILAAIGKFYTIIL